MIDSSSWGAHCTAVTIENAYYSTSISWVSGAQFEILDLPSVHAPSLSKTNDKICSLLSKLMYSTYFTFILAFWARVGEWYCPWIITYPRMPSLHLHTTHKQNHIQWHFPSKLSLLVCCALFKHCKKQTRANSDFYHFLLEFIFSFFLECVWMIVSLSLKYKNFRDVFLGVDLFPFFLPSAWWALLIWRCRGFFPSSEATVLLFLWVVLGLYELWSCIQWQGFFRMLKYHCLSPGDVLVLTSLEFSFLIILSYAEQLAEVYIHLAACKLAAWI